MFKVLLVVSAFYLNFPGSEPLIVPGEIPTLLSLIYSNIPTIKKGTDSRLGWGFRLGNRADFQVLVELGPQTNTQPLGNQPDTSSSSSKRQVASSLSEVLWAQRQREKQKGKEIEKPHFSNTDGGQWLKQWREGMNPQKQTGDQMFVVEVEEVPKNDDEPVIGVGEVDARLVIPADQEIEEKKNKKMIKKKVAQTTTVTPKEDSLDNVEIDD